MASPISATASALALMNSHCSPTAVRMSCSADSPGNCHFGFLMKSAVGVCAVLTTARVRPACVFEITSSLAETMASQPMTRSASPMAMRVAWRSSGFAAICTWERTAPPFCASPAMSSTVTPLFSRCAAMPSRPPIVTTPVPPTPVTSTPNG
ncbi:hypothetical protein D3C81_1616460 [compost metagenome]